MCGIVGYVGKKDCTKELLDSLSKLEYRGYDSAGIAVFENGTLRTMLSRQKRQRADLLTLKKSLKERVGSTVLAV